MKKLASVDAGNKNLKVFIEGMKEPIIIINNQCMATTLNFKSNLNVFKREGINPINLLDVTVVSNGMDLGRRYVGGLAVKHGGEERSLKKEKSNDNDILFSLITAIGFGIVQPDAKQKRQDSKISLGTCLPSVEYMQNEKVDLHEKRLIGTHQVIFHDPCFNGVTVEIEIFDDEVLTLPEGTAALLNVATDIDGNALPEFSDLEDRIVIVVDIGGGTTDISAIMNYEVVEELVDYIDKGILYPEERIINTLKRIRPGYIITKSELDYYVRKKDSKLIDGEKTWDVKSIVEAEFAELGKEIARKVNNLIQVAPDNLKRKIAKVVLTGGASLLLSQYIKNEIVGYTVVSSGNCINDNVLGCFKAIKIKAAENSLVEDQVFDESKGV